MSVGGWDVHTHIVPPDVVAAAEIGRYGMLTALGSLKVCGHGVPIHPISVTGKLIERLHADQLDGAIVSIPPPLFRPDLSKVDRRSYSSFLNDSLISACQTTHTSLRPLAYLPAQDPELSADIVATLDRQWAGAVMGTELGPISYASPRFEPVWESLSEKNLPLFIHPGATSDARLVPFYMTNLLGNSFETTIAAANLVLSGVLQRHPRLKVILAHGGGCVAALCGRWQYGAITRRPGIPEMQLAPKDAVRRFYVDSLVYSGPFLEAIVKIIGEDRVLLGSDWPFPMGAPTANHDLGSLDPDLRLRIRKTNAEEAFGSRLQPE